MVTVKVFDPAMCCVSGVCGPSVDPELVRFASDIDWLVRHGVRVERYNLAQQPAFFVENSQVKSALEEAHDGEKVKVLPIVLVNDSIKAKGRYPAREELAEWAGLAAPEPSIYTPAVAELVAIGAAIASNCEPCFKAHFDKARKLGVSKDDMLLAVKTAQAVKEAPAKAMLALSDRFLIRQEVAPNEATRFSPLEAKPCCAEGDSSKGSCC